MSKKTLSNQFNKPPPLAPSARSVGKSFMANKPSSYVAGSGEEVYEGPQAGVGINKQNRTSTAFNFNTKEMRPGHVQSHSRETSTSIYGGPIGAND